MSVEAHKSLEAAAAHLGDADRAVADARRELRRLDLELRRHAKDLVTARKELYRDKMMGGLHEK